MEELRFQTLGYSVNLMFEFDYSFDVNFREESNDDGPENQEPRIVLILTHYLDKLLKFNQSHYWNQPENLITFQKHVLLGNFVPYMGFVSHLYLL